MYKYNIYVFYTIRRQILYKIRQVYNQSRFIL